MKYILYIFETFKGFYIYTKLIIVNTHLYSGEQSTE